jgi:NAD+ diphosphatase
MSALTSPSFKRLVQALKTCKKTISVVEQCCGGTINASIMAQPGTSSVYYGGSVVYNTKKGKGLLLNSSELHKSLTNPNLKNDSREEYIQSKLDWTAKTSVAFCESLGTDFAIAEGGAAGPTFRPKGMDVGFAVLTIAGKDGANDVVKVLKQKVVHSESNDREKNMRMFADASAELLTELLNGENSGDEAIIDKTHHKLPLQSKQHIVLDRATHLRTNPEKLAELEPKAMYVLTKANDILFRSPSELALLSNDEVSYLKNGANEMTFLGRLSDEHATAIFGIDIKASEDNATVSFEGCSFLNTRTSAPLLPPLENELALHMMAYANWQRRSRHCSSCGAPLTLIHAGTAQECSSCNAMSWPRQDPSMIASITSRCGERILLARSKRHPPKMHTVLAGFVEAGETFEAAVARETWEETGIRIDEGSVKYIGSQPWPFPQSCMIAFSATADDSQPLNIDENELVDAMWFDKKDVLAATKVEGPVMQHDVAKAALEADPSLPLLVPPKRVIARTLIDTWLGTH